MRQLKQNLLKRLTKELSGLLECIKNDGELDLQIRDNYINVYYKGGNILEIRPRSFHFDEMYFNDYNVKRSTEAKKDKGLVAQFREKRDRMLKLLPDNPQKYFSEAKSIMDKWDNSLKDVMQHNEKKEQQLISLVNRKDSDYIVLDVEYSVSRNSDFSYNGSKGKKVPRFDIIAIHDEELVVIELKKGLGATPGKSGIGPHIDCFDNTIGRDKKRLFVTEMRELLKQKQELKLLDKSLKIKDCEPSFVFAFADENGKDEFNSFASKCFFQKFKGDLLYLNGDHKLRRAMKRDFYFTERKKQFKYMRKYDFGEMKYVLWDYDCINNLYSKIQEDAIEYFKRYDIAWWQCKGENNIPSGHIVSSQIHCLNHLFDIRTDKDAVKLIAEKATSMQFDEILPSLIDNKEKNSYITFEFALDNDKLLGENDKGRKRGTLCTSIDVMIMARKGDRKWLIPIEWKYTESYKREDKTNETRESRYSKLIETSKRLRMPEDGIPHSVYFIEPNYELMRQTLLCEQLVANGYADDFFHINVIPAGNTELRNAVEKEFIPMLKDDSKFKIIDPQDLLSPLEENNLHPELIEYLKKRYWYR
jgi:hypothetical protein